MKHKLIALYICIFLLFVGGGIFIIPVYLNRPVNKSGESVLYSIARGSSVKMIANSLAEENLIRSATYALFYTRFQNLSLKAGTYRLSPAMSSTDILRYIASGKQETLRVTIPEGLTLSKTALHLEKAGVVPVDDFLKAASDKKLLAEFGIPFNSAEGFLFPDTYFFPYGVDASSVVHLMVKTFFQKISGLQEKNDTATSLSLYDTVILASIIEREYRIPEEAPVIASVFMNRLHIGMGLQSCATIEYIITEIEKKPRQVRLTADDLEIKSDYNTYLWAGLPPGPICSPGLVSLSAAFTPAKTHYLYFRLVDAEDGRHAFTSSLDEHIKAGRQLILKKVPEN